MSEILRNIWAGIVGGSWLDPLNFVLGVTGVGLMVKRSLWAFPLGLAGVTVQGILFYQTKLYADGALQIFFFVALAWGWWHWVRDRGDASELPVTTISTRERGVVLLLTLLATVAWALAARRWTNSLMPWRDAAIAMLQVAGQVLQSRKKLENWAFFTVANVIAIPAYWSAELAFTAFLFGLYLVLGLMGWREWMKSRAGFQPAPQDGRQDAGATP